MVAATHPIKKKALSLLLRTLFTIRRRHMEHRTVAGLKAIINVIQPTLHTTAITGVQPWFIFF
jgi:hypothetical protein